MPLASRDELAKLLGITFSANEEPRVDQALAQASAVVESYVGQALAQVTETVALVGSSTTKLALPASLVTAMASVTHDTVLLPITAYTWDSSGVLTRIGRTWRGSVVVTYTHGFAVVPDDVKLAVLSVARELYEGAHPQTFGATVEGSPNFVRTYPSRVVGQGWTGLVARYRLSVLA